MLGELVELVQIQIWIPTALTSLIYLENKPNFHFTLFVRTKTTTQNTNQQCPHEFHYELCRRLSINIELLAVRQLLQFNLAFDPKCQRKAI
jgi:hypothetical protein